MEEEPFAHPDFLPDGFGTVGRQAFEEILVGAPPSWAPATPIWTVVELLVLAAIGYAIYRAVSAYRHDAYRRAAKRELVALRARVEGGERGALIELPPLLKRCAMAAYGRTEVAALSGDAWARFLDAKVEGAGFVDGAGAALPLIVYRGPDAVDGGGVAGLFESADKWIRGHRV